MSPPHGPRNPDLAYHSQAFLDSDDARALRILAEYLEPLFRFRREGVHDTVVFFGSARLSQDGPLGRYYREARELARRLAEWSQTLPGGRRFVVCTGGGGGLMEAANRRERLAYRHVLDRGRRRAPGVRVRWNAGAERLRPPRWPRVAPRPEAGANFTG